MQNDIFKKKTNNNQKENRWDSSLEPWRTGLEQGDS